MCEGEEVCVERRYDVALWVKSEIDLPGRTTFPKIMVEVDAVNSLAAVQVVMWAYGLWYVYRAACSDGSGMIWRWSKLRNGPVGEVV